MPDARPELDETLRRAYDERSRDLLEARTSLAEAVAMLTSELRARREEVASLAGENDSLREHLQRAQAEAAAQRERADAAEVERDRLRTTVARIRGMKVVRYAAPARRLILRLRSRRQ
jgi:septal ring factor EnvC (AmiA/AmiB activator)